MDIDTAMEKAAEKLDGATTATETPVTGESTSTPAQATETSTATPAPAPAQGDRARDEHGRFAAKPADKPPEAPAGKASETKPAAPGATQTPAPAPTQGAATATPPGAAAEVKEHQLAGSDKAPASWRPLAREKWAALPAEVREEWSRREKEMTRALSEMAPVRQEHQRFQQAVAPFSAMLAAEGVDPVAASQSLLRQAYLLRAGAPQQRAHLLANWIQQSGVPIELLAQALDAAPAPQQPQAVDPQSLIRQAKEELRREAQTIRDQHLTTRARTEWETFAAAHPYAEDLRERVGVLLGAASQQGVAMSLEEAYNTAAALDPQVSKILAREKAAKDAAEANANAQRSAAAAVSIKSRPAALASAQPKGLDGALEAARQKLGM